MFKLIVPVVFIFGVLFAKCSAEEISENEIDFKEERIDFDDVGVDDNIMYKEFLEILSKNMNEGFGDYFSEEVEETSYEELDRKKRADNAEFSSLPHLLTTGPNSYQDKVNDAHASDVAPEVSTVASKIVNKAATVDDEEIFEKEAANANYDFANVIDDNINGNFMFREEKRNGHKVTGQFSYDDGHIMRTVSYVADENGFRIIKDEVVPSIKSVTALSGKAAVASFSNGNNLNYQISQSDIHQVKPLRRNEMGRRQK